MKTLIIIILISIGLRSFSGEITDYYFNHMEDGHKAPAKKSVERGNGGGWDEITSTNHGITEIGIERTGCLGSCPSYTLFGKSDGSFHYIGDKFSEHVGEFIGTVPIWQFHAIARFIRDSDYMSLADWYVLPATDLPSTFTMVVMNGKTKVIRNYADSGPTKLWAIQQLIDDLMVKAKWIPVPKSKSQKKKL